MRTFTTIIAMLLVMAVTVNSQAQITVSFNKTDTVNIGFSKGKLYPIVAPTLGYKLANLHFTAYSMMGAGDCRFDKDGPYNTYLTDTTGITFYETGWVMPQYDTVHVMYPSTSNITTPVMTSIPFWLICPNVVTDTAYIPLRIQCTATDVMTANTYQIDTTLFAIYYSNFIDPSYVQQNGTNVNIVIGDWSGSIDNYLHVMYSTGHDSMQCMSDTTIALWNYLAMKGVTDTCVEVYMSRGGDWCSVGNQIICSTTAPLSVGEVSTNHDYQVWPNPTMSDIHFSKKMSYELLSFDGRILRKGVGSMISLSDMSTGVYLLRTSSGVKKIVKQ